MFKSKKLFRQAILVLLVALMLTITALPTFAQQDDGDTPLYTVQPGDTLQSIAQRFSTTVEVLMQLNLITSPNYLQVGQVLVIPATGGAILTGATRVHVVQPGENLAGIASFYNTSVQALVATNALANQNQIFVGQTLIVPAQGGPVVNQPTQATTTTTTQVTTTVTTQVQQPVIIVRQIINGRYTVQYGDTLLAISRSFGVDAWTIARANGIYNLNWIYAGQRLIIPGYGGY